MFSKQIIERAPDRMLDFSYNHVLLAYRHNLIYINVKDTGICENESVNEDSNFVTINI